MPSIAINVIPFRTPSAARSLRPIQVSCSTVLVSLRPVICRTSSAMQLAAWRRKSRPVSSDPLSLISQLRPPAVTHTVNSVCDLIRSVMSYRQVVLVVLSISFIWAAWALAMLLLLGRPINRLATCQQFSVESTWANQTIHYKYVCGYLWNFKDNS